MLAALGIWDPLRNIPKNLVIGRTKFLVLHSSKMVQRSLGLSDPPLPPASVVNSTMEESLIGGVSPRPPRQCAKL